MSILSLFLVLCLFWPEHLFHYLPELLLPPSRCSWRASFPVGNLCSQDWGLFSRVPVNTCIVEVCCLIFRGTCSINLHSLSHFGAFTMWKFCSVVCCCFLMMPMDFLKFLPGVRWVLNIFFILVSATLDPFQGFYLGYNLLYFLGLWKHSKTLFKVKNKKILLSQNNLF